MLLLFLQLVLFVFLLATNGEPLRFLLFKRLRMFSDLDVAQAIILDIYLGCLILYVIAILPFGFFSGPLVLGLSLASLLFSAAVHSKNLKQASFGNIKADLLSNKYGFVDGTLLFAMFGVFLLIQLIPVSNFVLGSVHDTSIHSLMVEVILEKNCVPLTLQPYLSEAIQYPQGAHIIFAYASHILGYNAPKTVFYVTPLFNSLSVFGAYFLGRKMWPHKPFYLGLSFMFAFISSWPLYITWGGNPFITGFPLFLINLGLLFYLIRQRGKTNLKELLAIGILFGYNGVLIVSYLEALVAIMAIFLIYVLVRRRNEIRRVLPALCIISLVGLLTLSPFLYRYFAFYLYPGHNIGVPSDFIEYPRYRFHIFQTLQWTLENLAPYPAARLITFLLVAFFSILVWKTKGYRDTKLQFAFTLTIFAASVLISFVSFLLPADFTAISLPHQGIILMIPVNILLTLFFIKFVQLLKHRKLKLISRIASKDIYSSKLLAIALLSLVTSPFLYYRFAVDPFTMSGTYGMFAVATQDDYDLMLWIKENLTSNAIILTNPNEPGLFIPPLSYHRIVYPYTASWYTRSYQTLIELLRSHKINDTAYKLMSALNITHVYIGSQATNWWLGNFEWDPLLLLGNPNFRLVKNIGKAYLFQLNQTHSNTVFFENFSHDLWYENGWQAYHYGNGLGNLTIIHDGENQSSLKVTAQAMYTNSEWKYASYIYRNIFVQNHSDVHFSFSFNATQGFNAEDAFAALISNVYHNLSIMVTTPNGVFSSYARAINTNTYAGSFNCSLSTLWQQYFGAPLPSTFILEFVNYDADGVENICYIDNIKVVSAPIG